MGGGTALLVVLSLIKNTVDNKRNKKEIDNATKNNAVKRGIVNCKPTSIESLVDTYGINGNLIISGGNERYRNRAIARLSHQALYKNECVVILHSGNQLLEQEIEAEVGTGFVQIFNSSNPNYDPFLNLSRFEVGSIILESSDKQIEPNGRSIIEGMYDFMTSKNTEPTT